MIDFDFDLDDELEEKTQVNKQSKVKQSTSTDNQLSGKKPLWKRILKGILIVLLLIVLSVSMFIGGLLAGSKDKGNAPQKVASIKSQSSILDDLESLKDSQISNLNDKLSKISKDGGSPSDAPLKNEQLEMLSVLYKSQAENIGTVDAFLEPLMALKNEAPQEEVDLVRKTISEKMTPSSAVTRSYEILKEPSASKVVGENGKKGAASQMWLMSFSGDERSYIVITPFITKEKIVHQLAFVKFNGKNIEDYRFVGLIDSPTKNAFTDALNKLNENSVKKDQSTPTKEEASKENDKKK